MLGVVADACHGHTKHLKADRQPALVMSNSMSAALREQLTSSSNRARGVWCGPGVEVGQQPSELQLYKYPHGDWRG